MQKFIGAKIVQAKPQQRDGEPGFLVVYRDGYESWSPEAAFTEAYRPTDGMSFGLALEALKKGKRVARSGWNGKGMWLMFVEGGNCLSEFVWDEMPVAEVEKIDAAPWIGMKTADSKFVPWLASQTDMLADDWAIVD